ncbi:MAG: FHA domain-containing protein [Acidobacteria bacterium]|nr:FHA domain-containing protein [Acidobacteriota bacterium]
MIERESTYVVTREDRSQDPVTFVAEGLSLGRLTNWEVCLNHPSVSRLHAGVSETGGRFYLYHLSPSNSTTLSGKLVEEKAALADGDLIQIGPFSLLVRIDGERLALTVRYQQAVRVGDVGTEVAAPHAARAPETGHAALDVFWEKRKREAGKMARPSELTCHAVSRSMGEGCASCHQTAAFDARGTDAHAAAGVGCAVCHGEHRGENFRPAVAPLSADFQPGVAREETCAGCHSDANKKTYNGRRVGTPHGGTFGYPVVDGRWKWEGLDEDEWNAKPDDLKNLLTTWKATTDEQRRSVQFHALHLHRVRAVAGLKGNEAGELTCSSCHKSLGAAPDRATPRTTCASCHNGRVDEQTGRALVAANAPDCTSCHVQHAGDRRRRNPSPLANR